MYYKMKALLLIPFIIAIILIGVLYAIYPVFSIPYREGLDTTLPLPAGTTMPLPAVTTMPVETGTQDSVYPLESYHKLKVYLILPNKPVYAGETFNAEVRIYSPIVTIGTVEGEIDCPPDLIPVDLIDTIYEGYCPRDQETGVKKCFNKVGDSIRFVFAITPKINDINGKGLVTIGYIKFSVKKEMKPGTLTIRGKLKSFAGYNGVSFCESTSNDQQCNSTHVRNGHLFTDSTEDMFFYDSPGNPASNSGNIVVIADPSTSAEDSVYPLESYHKLKAYLILPNKPVYAGKTFKAEVRIYSPDVAMGTIDIYMDLPPGLIAVDVIETIYMSCGRDPFTHERSCFNNSLDDHKPYGWGLTHVIFGITDKVNAQTGRGLVTIGYIVFSVKNDTQPGTLTIRGKMNGIAELTGITMCEKSRDDLPCSSKSGRKSQYFTDSTNDMFFYDSHGKPAGNSGNIVVIGNTSTSEEIKDMITLNVPSYALFKKYAKTTTTMKIPIEYLTPLKAYLCIPYESNTFAVGDIFNVSVYIYSPSIVLTSIEMKLTFASNLQCLPPNPPESDLPNSLIYKPVFTPTSDGANILWDTYKAFKEHKGLIPVGIIQFKVISGSSEKAYGFNNNVTRMTGKLISLTDDKGTSICKKSDTSLPCSSTSRDKGTLFSADSTDDIIFYNAGLKDTGTIQISGPIIPVSTGTQDSTPTYAPSLPSPTYAPSLPSPTYAPSLPSPTYAPSFPSPTLFASLTYPPITQYMTPISVPNLHIEPTSSSPNKKNNKTGYNEAILRFHISLKKIKRPRYYDIRNIISDIDQIVRLAKRTNHQKTVTDYTALKNYLMMYTNYDSNNPNTFKQPTTSKWNAIVKANAPSNK